MMDFASKEDLKNLINSLEVLHNKTAVLINKESPFTNPE